MKKVVIENIVYEISPNQIIQDSAMGRIVVAYLQDGKWNINGTHIKSKFYSENTPENLFLKVLNKIKCKDYYEDDDYIESVYDNGFVCYLKQMIISTFKKITSTAWKGN